jgi:metabolite-proton symporter
VRVSRTENSVRDRRASVAAEPSTAAPSERPDESATPPSAGRILFASLIGTTIEFFDFYIFATAAVLVFPKLFFPPGDAAAATLQSLATFSVAFFARPIGSAVFGHFGDRLGRKATLVAALLTMGVSTVAIGLLPGYESIGVLAPLLLVVCRIGQGLGVGGEWGGAVLLATENAPRGRRSWYGMFPQLGAPIGFFCSTGAFLLLTLWLDEAQFLSWGWRIPFVASAALVFVGLYVRLRLTETPAFARARERREVVRVPMVDVLRHQTRALILGTLTATSVFVIFYLMTVFSLGWGTQKLGFTRGDFLVLQMGAVPLFALTIPLAAIVADRIGVRRALAGASLVIVLFGFAFAPLFSSAGSVGPLTALCFGMAAMGCMYGPLGAVLGGLFPTSLRYTGSSLAFNLAGILGGSLTPYVATELALRAGLTAVGLYISVAGVISLFALLLLPTASSDEV